MPIDKDVINIMNQDDFFKHFGKAVKDPKTTLRDLLMESIKSNLMNYEKRITFSPFVFDSIDLSKIKYDLHSYNILGKETSVTYNFNIPDIKSVQSKIVPNVIVIITSIDFSRKGDIVNDDFNHKFSHNVPDDFSHNVPTMSEPGVFTPKYKQEYLVSYVDYIIWDFDKNEPIYYGETKAKTSIFIVMTKDTWLNQIQAITESIFNYKTPFPLSLL
jgi:hypothetical protein